CGSLVGSQIFVAGGTEAPDATAAMRNFWSLDLSRPSKAWQEREPWPGPERSHAFAATLGDSFFLASGFAWTADSKGAPIRCLPFFTDAYLYTPSDGHGSWQSLAELPRAIGGAPTPAMVSEGTRVFVAGGVDDRIGSLDQATHPGFLADVFCYDALKD